MHEVSIDEIAPDPLPRPLNITTLTSQVNHRLWPNADPVALGSHQRAEKARPRTAKPRLVRRKRLDDVKVGPEQQRADARTSGLDLKARQRQVLLGESLRVAEDAGISGQGMRGNSPQPSHNSPAPVLAINAAHVLTLPAVQDPRQRTPNDLSRSRSSATTILADTSIRHFKIVAVGEATIRPTSQSWPSSTHLEIPADDATHSPLS
jgi:hypothetical protein